MLEEVQIVPMDIISEHDIQPAPLEDDSRQNRDEEKEEEEEEKTEEIEDERCIVVLPRDSAVEEKDKVSHETIPSVITAIRRLQPLDNVFEYPRQSWREHHNATSTKAPVSTWWKWIVVALLVLLSVLVVAMLVSVLYWLRQDRSDANNVAGVLIEGGENQDDHSMASSPSSIPATTGSSKTNFMPLAIHPDATFHTIVSSCDDCEEYVELPFEFLWLGKLPVTSISVSSNGVILVGSNNLFGPCCGTINVVAADLDPSSHGGIWTLSTMTGAANGVSSSAARAPQQQQQRQSTPLVEAFLVSWEMVPFWSDTSKNGSNATTTFVNAQATLYPSGNIDLCWDVGQTDRNSFSAGIIADAVTPQSKFPARSEPFNDMGQTKGGAWPLHQCRSFVFSELDDVATTTTGDNDESLVRSLSPSPMPAMFAPHDGRQPGTTSCTSTIGDGCITNATSLRYALLQARPGETIALCGGGSLYPPITTEDGPLIIQEFNIILCCADSMTTTTTTTTRQTCEIRGNGMHRNLIVTGANVTLQGLVFSNGFGGNGNGGNVEIRATGRHRILHCEFVNGTATTYGGNLAVTLADTVVVQNSSFYYGLGLGGAGGLYLEASESSVVSHSIFEGNVGGSNDISGSTAAGGGLLVVGGRSVEIVQSYFLDNSADLGGGFFVSHLGSFPMLKILHCHFELNSAVELGGPGAMMVPLLTSTVDIRHNGGAPNNVVLNSTTGCEHGFEVALHDFDIDSYACVELEDDFVISDF